MIERDRGKIVQDLVNRFCSSLGVTVPWGCVSLRQPEHAPLTQLLLNEFLMVLAQHR